MHFKKWFYTRYSIAIDMRGMGYHNTDLHNVVMCAVHTHPLGIHNMVVNNYIVLHVCMHTVAHLQSCKIAELLIATRGKQKLLISKLINWVGLHVFMSISKFTLRMHVGVISRDKSLTGSDQVEKKDHQACVDLRILSIRKSSI